MTCPLKVFSSLFLQLLVVSGYLLTAESAPEIPSFVKICHRNDPKLNDCVHNSVDSLKPHFKRGVPSLHLVSCDPFRIPRMKLEHATSVPLTSTYTDIRVWGVADFQITEIEINPVNFHTSIKLNMPRLETISNYEVKYGIGYFTTTTTGEARGNFTGVDIVGRADVERYQKEGQTHLRITDFYVNFELAGAHIHLVDANPIVNMVINQSWSLLVSTMKPILTETVGDMFKEVVDKVLADHPLDTLFPL